MIVSRVQILAVIISLLVILLVVHLIRRKQLRVEYSIVWLFGSSLLIFFSVWRDFLDIVADFLGIFYAPALLLLIMILVGTLGFLHFSVKMSMQAEYNKKMTQRVALLQHRVEELSKMKPPGAGSLSESEPK